MTDNRDNAAPMAILSLLLILFGALFGGCARQAPPPECVDLRGVAIQHPAPHWNDGTTTPFRAVYDGTLVQTPAWVAAPRYDSRQVRLGRRTWWLADRPDSTTDTMAAWEVAR